MPTRLNAPTSRVGRASAPDQPDLFSSLTLAEQVAAPRAGRVHHGDPVTSKRAAAAASFRRGAHAVRILRHLLTVDGATGHECWQHTGGAYPHVATTRLEELRDDFEVPLVEMTPQTRPTPSGVEAHVWRLTPAGRAVAAALNEQGDAAA